MKNLWYPASLLVCVALCCVLFTPDKPIRLLVTFNDKVQNATAGVSHYRKPADFRIDLRCTK
jgi:hypothetical protein